MAAFRLWVRARHLECSHGKFTVDGLNWKASVYPELRSKAHNCRVILAWLAEVCRTVVGAPRDRLRARAFFHLAAFCHMVDLQPVQLDPVVAREMADHGSQFLACYYALARDALTAGELLYAVKPKLHQFEHLCDGIRAELKNPRFFWNYGGEDFLGRIVTIARMCHRATVASRCLERCRLLRMAGVY